MDIFEEQYIPLVNDSMKEDRCFLIPYVIRGKNQKFGSFVRILEIEPANFDKEFDITLAGEEIFKTEASVFVKNLNKLHPITKYDLAQYGQMVRWARNCVH